MKFLDELFRKKEDFAEIRATADMKGMEAAKRSGADTWQAPTPTEAIRTACLKRTLSLVQRDRPEFKLSDEDLLQLEPPNLTEEELNQWYWGIRGEAAHQMLVIVNGSYSKTEVHRKLLLEGLNLDSPLLDPLTQAAIDDVVKYVSN